MDIKKGFLKDIEHLAEELRPQEKGSNIGFFGHLQTYGKPEEALFYSELFMPELIELENHIFLKGIINAEKFNDMRAKETRKWEAEEIELSYNQLEIHHAFYSFDLMAEGEVFILANRVRDSWEGWLNICYPDRKFNVMVAEYGEGPVVQFHEIR